MRTNLFGLLVRVLVVAAAMVVIFLTPAWSEPSSAVVPIWWPQSGSNRSLIASGALIDGMAAVALVAAVVWPRIVRH
jgi:hypothetical protein